MNELKNEAQRRRAIAWAIALTADTPLEPEQYESDLLELYALGKLTLDQVLAKLDNRVQHILYRSQATQPLTAGQLTDLLEESRAWNAQYQITGLLCYCTSGHFVQLIEGSAANVNALFARIRRDPRHHQVLALSDRATNTRWFPDWQMASSEMDSPDFFWLIGYLEARGHNLVMPQIPVKDGLLLTLLAEFSKP
ncbi:MAG: hypothetical protein EOO56_00790 [Hymenobacter sp.]|nr:MAG: hypothetical protein EOO56_00790 [Hymenobacter sp.]